MLTIGEYLKNCRIKSGLTQVELSKRSNFSCPQFYSNVEREICQPSPRLIKSYVKNTVASKKKCLEIWIQESTTTIRKSLQ